MNIKPPPQTDQMAPPGRAVRSPILRVLLIVFSWLMVATGVIGIFVPGLPTTVFLLAAAWGFSRGSERLHLWLWWHPHLGPPVRNWYTHRIIPIRAKLIAVAMMSLSVAYIAYAVSDTWAWQVLALVLLPVAGYVLTRASTPPDNHGTR